MPLISTPDDQDADATWEVVGTPTRLAGGLIDLFLIAFLASGLLTAGRLHGWLALPPDDPATAQLADILPTQLVVLAVQVAYYFLWEALAYRTPGKFVCRTRVMGQEGEDPSVGAIALRTLVRLVPLEPASFLSTLPGGWHDRWTRTCVVRRVDNQLTEDPDYDAD